MISNQKFIAQTEIVEQFKGFYADCYNLQVDEIDQFYHDDIVFKDPVNVIRGKSGLHKYLSDMTNTVPECRFEYIDELVSVGSAYIKWNMHYRHPKLGNKPLVLRGMSHIQYTDKITYHEDVYDMGEMIYEHVPLLGRCILWIKKRLES